MQNSGHLRKFDKSHSFRFHWPHWIRRRTLLFVFLLKLQKFWQWKWHFLWCISDVTTFVYEFVTISQLSSLSLNPFLSLHCSVSMSTVVHLVEKTSFPHPTPCQSFFWMRQYVHSVATCLPERGGVEGKNWKIHLQDYDRKEKRGQLTRIMWMVKWRKIDEMWKRNRTLA